MSGYGQLHETTETWFDEALRSTGSNIVTLYRGNVSGEYVPVFWVPFEEGLEPPRVSSASDLASHFRGFHDSFFEMDGGTFKDASVRRGLEMFGISTLIVIPLPGSDSRRYCLSAGTAGSSTARSPSLRTPLGGTSASQTPTCPSRTTTACSLRKRRKGAAFRVPAPGSHPSHASRSSTGWRTPGAPSSFP